MAAQSRALARVTGNFTKVLFREVLKRRRNLSVYTCFQKRAASQSLTIIDDFVQSGRSGIEIAGRVLVNLKIVRWFAAQLRTSEKLYPQSSYRALFHMGPEALAAQVHNSSQNKLSLLCHIIVCLPPSGPTFRVSHSLPNSVPLICSDTSPHSHEFGHGVSTQESDSCSAFETV